MPDIQNSIAKPQSKPSWGNPYNVPPKMGIFSHLLKIFTLEFELLWPKDLYYIFMNIVSKFCNLRWLSDRNVCCISKIVSEDNF